MERPLITDPVHSHVGEIGGGAMESRLDLVLGEELAANLDFAAWFLDEAGTWRGSPPAAVEDARVRLNLHEHGEGIPDDAAGETDIELTAVLEDGRTVTLLIEDKLWAPFQDRQPERYSDRARARGARAVIVAPAGYLQGRAGLLAPFDGRVSIEQIIDHLETGASADDGPSPTEHRRARWRAQLLRELIARPMPAEDHPGTVDFTQFCVRWFHDHDRTVVPRPRSLHTEGQGWLWFEVPVGLGYKASGWSRKPSAAVDLYVGDHGFEGTADDLRDLADQLGLPDGFRVDTDTAKAPNVVLRCDCEKVDPADGSPAGEVAHHVAEALEACSRAAAWLRAHEHQLRP